MCGGIFALFQTSLEKFRAQIQEEEEEEERAHFASLLSGWLGLMTSRMPLYSMELEQRSTSWQIYLSHICQSKEKVGVGG